MSEQTVLIQNNDKSFEAPVKKATMGSDAFDINGVQAATGQYTFNDGLGNTASCQSAITFINGGEGKLYYRGYPIEQLADKVDFTQVIYLLCHGELPTSELTQRLQNTLSEQATLPESVVNAVSQPSNTHPMSMIMTAVSALSGQNSIHLIHSIKQCVKLPLLAY